MCKFKIKKILYFVDSLSQGGIQSLLLETLPKLDRNVYEPEILFLDNGPDWCVMEKQFEGEGIKVNKIKNVKFRGLISLFEYKSKLDYFFKKNKYDIVHINSGPKNYLIAKCAKKNGVKHIIYHSHNTNYQTQNYVKKKVGDFLKKKVIKYCDKFAACSYEAGEWLFPNNIMKGKEFTVIHNPINTTRFLFSEKDREKVRSKLKLDDKFVLIDVARFDYQKNHNFIIDVVFELKKLTSDFALLLVGNGELEDEIKNKVIDLDLEGNVLFLGRRLDVEAYLSASDLFLLPSLYEGFPIVSVEAQANGINCILSNSITKEAKLNYGTKYLDLKDGPKSWADYIYNNYIDRKKLIKREEPRWLNDYSFNHFYTKLVDLYVF